MSADFTTVGYEEKTTDLTLEHEHTVGQFRQRSYCADFPNKQKQTSAVPSHVHFPSKQQGTLVEGTWLNEKSCNLAIHFVTHLAKTKAKKPCKDSNLPKIIFRRYSLNFFCH